MVQALDRSRGGRGANKSPEAFRTISEVASELDVPQHVLRFWESRFSQVKPLKRGGGRRYYRPLDVDLLKGIRRLLYTEGYTIKGVQKILREKGAKAVVALAPGGRAAGAKVATLCAVADAEDTAGPGLSPVRRAQIAAVLDDLRAIAARLARAG